ncbi:MAG: hypothetical protein Q8O24_08910 [Gallionellaceae bacterium]|nr:hypothetical protein [Gallionellaceae bacterium]
MFTLPSLWNLLVSTFVFFIAVWYLRRYFETQGIAQGMTRSVLVFVLASLVSWGAGEVADWSEAQIEGPQPVAQTSSDL